MKVEFFIGDLVEVKSDILITALNCSNPFSDRADKLIIEVVGKFFHSESLSFLEHMKNIGQEPEMLTIINEETKNNFKGIIFIVDDVKTPLEEIIYEAFINCNHQGFKTISISVLGFEKLLDFDFPEEAIEIVKAMVKGIKRGDEYIKKNPNLFNEELPEEVRIIVSEKNRKMIELFQGFL